MQEIPILYEDNDMLAVLKPAGMVVHHDAEHTTGTIVDWLLEHYPEIQNVGDPERPGIVHRLDKDTSGVLLVAKNKDAHTYLKNLFRTGAIEKKYIALVVGNVRESSGKIQASIARSRKHFEKRVVGGGQGKSREAVTLYKVLRRFDAAFTLLEVVPKTGRTHQIRSHLAHIGHPVVCDALYAGKQYVCPGGLSRHFLHAASLGLSTIRGTRLLIEAELPEDLEFTLKRLQKNA